MKSIRIEYRALYCSLSVFNTVLDRFKSGGPVKNVIFRTFLNGADLSLSNRALHTQYFEYLDKACALAKAKGKRVFEVL